MESFVQMAVKMDSCVAEELFYKKLESMKSSRQGKASNLTVYLSDEFYDKAKAWLTTENSKDIERLSISDVATITCKNWTLQHGKIANPDGKFVIPKRDILHKGRDKTEYYVRKSYVEISQKVITLLVSLCKLHQQQRSVTNHVKKPVMKPLMADGFLKHVEIDLFG